MGQTASRARERARWQRMNLSAMTDRVMYWRGKPVEYLSREEAIEAVKILVGLYYREQAPRMISRRQGPETARKPARCP
jgi:hypothetical protein